MKEWAESRLLRLDVSPTCNFECTFCCWRDRRDASLETRVLPPDGYRALTEAAVRSGCLAVHLTGGEPLALGRSRVCAMVRAICSVNSLRHFYITTNGSYLDDDYCSMLYDSGLRWLTVSVGADTEEKFQASARPMSPHVGLGHVLSRIELAVRRGITVRVHVPLTLGGVSTYEELLSLVAQVERLGVREVGFFKLNKTRDNAVVFDSLHSPDLHPRIVEDFASDSRWMSAERNGYRLFTSPAINCDPFLPLLDVSRRSRCQRAQLDCEDHCQGTYSAYLRTTKSGAYFRACHREFDDRRNEFPIPQNLLRAADAEGLEAILGRVWSWTHGGSCTAPD